MTTKANRQRSRKKKPEMQADDVYIPTSVRKPQIPPPPLVREADPLGDLCGEPFHPVAIYLTAAAIAFAGGLGLGWAVWA